MPSRLLIFTGAPESRALDWNTPDLLVEFDEPIASFMGIQTAVVDRPDPDQSIIPASAPTPAAWRSLTLERERIHTGYTQQQQDSSFGFNLAHGPEPIHQPDDFLTIASISPSFDESSVVHGDLESQFYEHSLALHQHVRSSYLDANLLRESEPQHSITSVMSEEDLDTASFLETTTHAFRVDGDEAVKEPLTFRGGDRLSDLKDIPSAAYLIKAQPQTITCNLIVGIISISQPRSVSTRWGSDRILVEVLVGDETKAGFAVTFWLPPGCETVKGSMLEGLRNRDVVLLQNVALNVFTKKVYGSSLRKGLTKVHLLFRARLDATDVGGHYAPSDLSVTRTTHAQLDKTRRVWDWVLRFVGPGPITAAAPEPGRRRSPRKSKNNKYALPSAAQPWDMPPPDTQ
ncbi:hypothetical protein B0T09DRAFT_353725 [Sordaria sp. MPI-SDFR-AT-0083]|nr:hypothetical protein B0T09DRAFT_353725 [Sordaria sp. MPI-SDFR-AT-0083]